MKFFHQIGNYQFTVPLKFYDVLEELNLDPARMAIEGYGQYYPNAR